LLAECYNIKPDKALMANSLEWRAPLQDFRLVEFAYHIPDNFKIKKWKEKSILKEVAKNYLPEEIFTRKKQGYWVPIFEWINTDLKQVVLETLKNSIMVKKWYFNQQQIDFYLQNMDKKYFSTRIWNLFSLELFLKVYELKVR
jgi:asparagine synthase (glutamine-hydrolysing)